MGLYWGFYGGYAMGWQNIELLQKVKEGAERLGVNPRADGGFRLWVMPGF